MIFLNITKFELYDTQVNYLTGTKKIHFNVINISNKIRR